MFVHSFVHSFVEKCSGIEKVPRVLRSPSGGNEELPLLPIRFKACRIPPPLFPPSFPRTMTYRPLSRSIFYPEFHYHHCHYHYHYYYYYHHRHFTRESYRRILSSANKFNYTILKKNKSLKESLSTTSQNFGKYISLKIIFEKICLRKLQPESFILIDSPFKKNDR